MSQNEVERLNPQFKWNWRRVKKRNRKRIEALVRHGYFEDCNYMPCKVTKLNYYGKRYDGDVDGESLIPGRHGCHCSILHCAPVALTEEEAKERAAFYIENGQLAYLKKYVYRIETPEQEAALIKGYEEWGWADKANP